MINKKAQMKIQQMAFVLLALVILFALVFLIYMRIRISGLEQNAKLLGDQETREILGKMSQSPELSWPDDSCVDCIDLEKAWALKSSPGIETFWNLDFLQITLLYPNKTGECNSANFPECRTITFSNKTKDIGAAYEAYVSLCRAVGEVSSGYVKCELGKIYASGKNIGVKK
jgi:hypothetical protein